MDYSPFIFLSCLFLVFENQFNTNLESHLKFNSFENRLWRLSVDDFVSWCGLLRHEINLLTTGNQLAATFWRWTNRFRPHCFRFPNLGTRQTRKKSLCILQTRSLSTFWKLLNTSFTPYVNIIYSRDRVLY